MKKYISIFLALVMMLAVVSCSGVYKRKGVSLNANITDYAVISNGGSAVQYGEYIYFINGWRGYTDESGNENVLGNVIKGGLYRTTLADSRSVAGQISRNYNFNYGNVDLNLFSPSFDAVSNMQFEYTEGDPIVFEYETDEDGEYILDDNEEKIKKHWQDTYLAKAELITGKVVGTSGYEQGGIFIFDNLIFFASPNNERDRANNVQYNRTDFWVTTLDGSKTTRIYTTQNDATASEYMFYKYDGSYYLVVHDGTDVVSVCVKSNMKAQKSIILAKDVLSVLFPSKDIYYNFTKNGKTYSSFEHTAADFIYFTRNATKDDSTTIGQVMEMIRPNGKESRKLVNDGYSVKLLNEDNGVIFYEVESVDTAKRIIATNFHNMLLATNSSYKAAHDALAHNYKDVNKSFAIDSSNYTSVRGIYPNPQNFNDVRILTFGSSSLNIVDALGERTLFEGVATFVKYTDNLLYFIGNDALQSIDLYEGGLATVHVSDASKDVTFKFDILDEYVVYFGDEDDLLKNCARFKRLDDLSNESLFIGERTEEETPNTEE